MSRLVLPAVSAGCGEAAVQLQSAGSGTGAECVGRM
jgi:hypothetical protein